MIDIAMPSAPSSSSMKLLIDTGDQRVLFAEAGKDVVDFILGLVAMPLGAVDRLLPGGGSLGSIGNVYGSAEKMDAEYMQSTAARDALLVARVPTPPPPSSPFVSATRPDSFPSRNGHGAAWTAPSAPLSGSIINSMMRPSEPDALPMLLYRCDACHASRLPQGSRGFVKDMAKYVVMDDLTVTPTTNFSIVELLKSRGVKDLDKLEERTVTVGHEEAMDILKAALVSKTVLTDVFIDVASDDYRNAALEQQRMRSYFIS